jgi:YHS domain-containing protein
MSQATACKENLIDPVCRMSVDSAAATIAFDHEGHTYYFCAESCRQAFEAKPKKYLNPTKKGIWGGYMERLQKSTGGKSMKCH